ncbi:MAG: hypothetical protein IPK44_01925 [Candidatus Accumulibacter sp.]|uniref:hypothetical protein n=1 Tax=Accumulibacter sp. TaxID=2053492 RepID=UPI0025892283|nr:hypothetical protein [Accumulibacter sp.]MBK8113359.1 hypothetical protein [Accumulibacter sp.]
MMTKKEFISQLTIFAGRYADERLGDNNKLFASNQQLREAMLEWEQKYHSAMAANKRLDEQSEGLQVEKQALLDIVSQWKSENAALNALNATLSEKLQKLEELRASQYQDFLKQEQSSQNWQGNYYAMQQSKDSLARKLDDAKAKLEEAEETIKDNQERYDEAYKVGNRWFEESKRLKLHCEKLKKELAELKKGEEALLRTIQNWERNYTSTKHELDLAQKELAEDNAEKLRLHCLLQSRTEELETAEKRHEDFKKRSDEILATMGENLQKKQETIEALTVWKEGTEKVLDSLEEKLKNAKDVIHTQENTIEWLDGRVKRLKEKKAKKEQND